METVCLDPLGRRVLWEVQDPLVNVVRQVEGDPKVQLECLVFLGVQVVLVDPDHLVSRVHLENQERMGNRDENTAKMTFEKSAHPYYVTGSQN